MINSIVNIRDEIAMYPYEGEKWEANCDEVLKKWAFQIIDQCITEAEIRNGSIDKESIEYVKMMIQ